MERFHLYRPPGAGGAFMASADDGPWVRLADAQAAIDAANQRATEAERYVAGQDVRSDFATATEMRAALDAANRRLALAVAEVRAWRAWKKRVVRYMTAEHPDPTPQIEALKAASVATDSDPELAKMIGGS